MSERGWIVVVHGSNIAESRGAIMEAVQRAAKNFPPPERPPLYVNLLKYRALLVIIAPLAKPLSK
jgi:hypothetical protein